MLESRQKSTHIHEAMPRLFKFPKVTEKPTAVCLNPAYYLKASGCRSGLCPHGRSPTHFLRTSELEKLFLTHG